MEQFLTPEQFAERLQISRRKAYNMIRSGEIKARKVGWLWRIRESEIERYMAGEEDPKTSKANKGGK